MQADISDTDIVVEIAKEFRDIDVSVPKLKKLVKAICKRFGLAKATISIGIVDDTEIRKLNAEFLNRKSVTDCLSFDLSDEAENSSKIFDLIVNGEKAVRQAGQRGHSPQAELALYITHGILHNLGFNDSTQAKAEQMHNTEDEILQQQGFGIVYDSTN